MPTILIIEDEPDLVRVLRSYLEKAGYKVISAGAGGRDWKCGIRIVPIWFYWI